MTIDIKTLLIFAVFTSTLFAGVQYYYQRFHKKYPGAREWLWGSLCILICYIFVVFRENYLPDWTSIFIGNSFLIYGTYLRLRASSLFSLKKDISPKWGLAAVVTLLLWVLVFYFIEDSIAWRSLGLMILCSLFLFTSSIVYWRAYLLKKHFLYLCMIVSFFVYACVVFWRAFYWPMHPTIQLFDNNVFQQIFFLVAVVVDIVTTQLFLMMNNTRLATDLHDLQIMIPICSYCKKIKLSNNQWEGLEDFLARQTQKDLSHSICPSCQKNLAKEIDEA